MGNDLSDKLKKLRLKSGMTQAQLAHKIDVSPSCIGMYEQGRREPKSHILSKMCKELDATGDYILDLDRRICKSKEFSTIVKEFTNFIETDDNILLNGVPIDAEDKKKISNALKVATAVILADKLDKQKDPEDTH